MKKILIGVLLLGSISAFSKPCIPALGDSQLNICVGDFVNVGSDFIKGAEVTGVNRRTNMVGLRSINNGRQSERHIRDIQVGKGCVHHDLMKVCVGDFVNVGDEYIKGAIVTGVNPSTLMVGLRSKNNSRQGEKHIDAVQVGKGCLYGACVGDFANIGDSYVRGAVITGINPNTLTVGLRSINNGRQGKRHIDEVNISTECLDYNEDQRLRDFYIY